MGNISLDNIPPDQKDTFMRVKQLIDKSTNYKDLVLSNTQSKPSPFKKYRQVDYPKIYFFVSQIKSILSQQVHQK